MNTTPPEGLSEAELADWQYEHRDELDAQGEDDEVVEVEYAQPLATTISFRLPVSEAAAISKAAQDAGISRSDWIRSACKAALGERPVVPDRVVKNVEQVADEVSATYAHLTELLDTMGVPPGHRRAAKPSP
ncbi:ribbon-helix-helix protein, CopG family [Actinobacteria bacterium YIM 96077]|uniref:Uncharacterized protein n=1 Tax=Phytoactinopolyspora halophila TaxID=1981511 RepID=A0A329QUF9_9ACTN|nr:ribbon-helix-helix protein, CopG family [Phytoactinopolyspora halophila]AYY13756.1 ribbon-helix-helix protein, CopG family [Actinobacteria bacterium YIM 96077]RAW15701.1 hypothetical protein DPM12_08635 [Phytoactinopolyspora halophila]